MSQDSIPQQPKSPISRPELKPGIYRHYKGPEYQVLDVAIHSETEEPYVVYKTLYGDFGTWIRPYSMFTEQVELDGKPVPRFAFVREA